MPARSHGMTGTRTYRIWKGMRTRCNNPNVRTYMHYGGRGIKVCRRWDSFENFLADMGEAPVGLSIERVDNDGHYQPENCVWADNKTQRRNTRLTLKVEFDGQLLPVVDVAERLGVSYSNLSRRLKNGTPIEEAMVGQALPVVLKKPQDPVGLWFPSRSAAGRYIDVDASNFVKAARKGRTKGWDILPLVQTRDRVNA